MENSMASYAREQYSWVKEARKVLIEFCNQLSPDEYVKETEEIGRGGSVRNLLVHNASTYIGWIARNALQTNEFNTEGKAYESITDITALYEAVDELMEDFFQKILDKEIAKVSFSINNRIEEAHPLKLFTHVITHEFHHKGQILSRCRQLGYVPADTDVIRF